MTGTPEPEPFEVEIVGVPEVAVTGESYELTVQSDEDSLVYAWRLDGGAIEPDDVQMVVWTAVLATCPVHPHNKGFHLRAVSLC